MKVKRQYTVLILFITLFFSLFAVRPLSLWAKPAPRAVQSAWRQASAIGQYRFATEIIQTTRPLPTLANAGKSSQTERLYIEGDANTAAERMNLKLWSEGGSAALGQGAIELQLADGRTLGRVNDSPWREVDNMTNFFAPDGDPLQFLRAAEQITELNRENRAGISFTRYTFRINSDTFARQMRQQLEEQLLRDGAPLPPGIQLDVPRLYAGMDGRGELWLDDDGLPLRQIITLEFPATEQEQVSAEIVTDFTEWGALGAAAVPERATAVFWQNQSRIGGFALQLIPCLLFLALAGILLFSRGKKAVYAALAVSMSLIMVAAPLLQGQRVYAFNQYYSRLRAEQPQAETAVPEQKSAAAAPVFNPARNPLTSPALQTTATTSETLEIFYDDGLDEDNDGVSNAQETEFYGTDPRNADSDGDGLDDGIEINELGTSPLNPDSDGDNLPDLAEVQGVVMPDSSRWYLDPLVGGSGGNGEADGVACRMIDTNNDTIPDTLDCPDTDGDNVPDVFDLDNDNDGVPDTIDSAPFSVMGDSVTGLQNQTFSLDLDNVTADEPIYVDFQLRPTNPDRLWYSLSKLDWPENDRLGQVQSVLETPVQLNEPGDMRLVPMLEIQMSGTPLPLPLTNPQTSLTFSGLVTGTAVFTQQGSDVELSLALSGTQQYATAVYNAACADIDDTTTAVYNLGNLGDGSTAAIANINLPQTIADGSHALRFTNANGEAECRPIPNIINGAYANQMIDLAALQTYGISAREKDNAGTLLAYVPLTLLYEQAGNIPAAFTGRMYYQPGQADFGAPQQTRLIWLVMTRIDRCLPVPDAFDPDPTRNDETEAEKVQAWCSDPANWADEGLTAVHAYYDDWRLTGLTVQRNLGLKTAVVYEDPAWTAAQPGYDPNGFNDDNLWSLALGLDVSFLAGRQDNAGLRDLTIDDLAPRWDKNSNGASSATERWELPQDALFVERFDYPDPSGIGDLAQAQAYQILENQFTAQAMSGGIQDPTLLFLQETRLRSLTLDYTDLITIAGNSAVLDIADSQLMPELVIAGMNWVPYRFNGSWQPYDMTEYWVDKGQDMDAALALTPGWTAEDVKGASFLARAYYVSLAAGRSGVVEIDNLAAWLPAALADADMQSLLVDENPLIGTGKAVKNLVSQSINVLTKLIGKDFIVGGGIKGAFSPPTLLQDTQTTLLQNKRGAINLGQGKITPASLAKAYGMDSNLLGADSLALLKKQARWSDGLGYASTLLSVAAAVTGFIAAGVAFVDEAAAKTIGIVSSSIAIAAASLRIASLILKLKVVTALNGLTSFGKVLSHFGKLTKISKSAAIFFAIGVAISLGLFIFKVVAAGVQFGSLAFDQLLANLIAGIIVGAILLAIAAIPVIGQLVAAIIAVIDAIISVICSLFPKENDTKTGAAVRDYLCGGISGLLAKLVAWLIYDQTPLVKMDRADRLNLTNFDFALGDPDSGYSAGNQLTVTTDVQSALYRNDIDDITDISPFVIHRWMFNDTNVKATTLVYTMTTTAVNVHESLTTESMSAAWQPPTADGFAPNSNFVITRTVDNGGNVILQTGINRRHPLWLTEGQAYKVQECAMLLLLPTCWLRDKRETQNLDLSEMLVFDVFPAALDEFMTLAAVPGNNDAYTQAWDDAFPALQDADGDGLISAAFGGPDPADFTPDYDNDGLSDFYEMQQSGTDPRLPDSDGDGLCDGQEAAFGTDPARADTDSDGLPDSDEVFHQDLCDGDSDGDTTEWLGGWEFVYAFNGALPLSTRVVPSPFSVNPDGDAYLDSLEKVYRFNPNVPSSGGILNLSSEVSATLARPGAVISYTAELENALRTNHALGLLDVQFDAAVTAGTVPPLAFNLQPQSAIATSGQITIDPALTQSRAVTLTNRAGALIVDPLEAVNGRSLWLRMNDIPTGDPLIFADDSLNNWAVSCPAANCPAAGVSGQKNNGLQFDPNNYLQMPDGLQAIGLTPNGFTVDLWLNPVLTGTFNLLESGGISWEMNNGRLELQVDGTPVADTGVPVVTADRWNHLTWRYDGFTQTNTFFVDGTAVFSQPYDLAAPLDSYAASDIYIRGVGTAAASAVLDEYAVYPFPLADSQIAAIGRDRVFYLRGETPFSQQPSTIQDDSAYQNIVACENDAFLSASCPGNTEANVDAGYNWSNSGSSADDMPVRVQPSPNLDLSGNNGAFTIAAWLNPAESPGTGGSGRVLGYGDNSSDQYLYPTLRVDPGSGAGDGSTNLDIIIAIEDETGRYCQASVYYSDMLGIWYHVSVVFEDPYFTFYVNGNPVTNSIEYRINGSLNPAVNDCDGVTPRSETQFYLGGAGQRELDSFSNEYFFNGNAYSGGLDELQIFNYALNGEEIADIYWDEQPIMDLRLDEPPASDRFADRAFNGFDATCALAGNNCPFSGLPGRDNQAALFDGADDFLTIADAAQLQMVNSSFTLAAWVNPDDSGVNPVIGADGANILFFGLDSGGVPQLRLNGATISGGGPVPAGSWSHLAARFDDTNNNTVTLFVNGAAVISQTLLSPLAANATLYAGRETGSYFNGYLDRVAVYRQALSDADVLNLTRQAPRVNLHLDDPFGAASFANSGDPALTAVCSGAACPQSDIKGRVYRGITLDGEDDLITIPESGSLLDFERFSVGLWVMPTQQKNGRQSLISKGSGGNTAFDLYIQPDSMRVGFTVGENSCAAQVTAVSVGALTENVWNQVMLVYDDAAGEARLYLNGWLDVTAVAAPPACQNDDPVQLGGNGVDLPFAGGMDELVLYPDALSDRDAAELVSYQLAWFDTRAGHKITIDADLPSVTLNVTAPYLPNRDKILAVTASDPTTEIVSVEYNVNGGGWQAAAPDVKAWLFTFAPTGSGSYTIDLRATDEAGNVASSSYTIQVDGAGPVLGPLNVAGATAVPAPWNAAQNAWAVALSGSVTAVDSPLDNVTVDMFNDLGASVSGVLTATVSGGVWQLDYPFTAPPNGVYTVTVRAADVVGNVTAREVPANVDGTPPDAAIAFSGSNNFIINSAVTLSGLVTETEEIASGVQGVEIAFHLLGQNDASMTPALPDNVLYLPLNEANDPASGQPVTRFANQTRLPYSILYEAVCAACPAAGSQGWLGNAAAFDGVDDALLVGGLGAELAGGALSLSAWVYPEAAAGQGAFLTLGSRQLLYDADAQTFVYADGGGQTAAAGSFAPNQWYQVTAVIAANGAGAFYVNGVSSAAFTASGQIAASDDLTLGGGAFLGRLDDTAVFSRALTEREAKQLYRAAFPVVHLTFDDADVTDGGLVRDESRFGQTAVFHGGAFARPETGIAGSGAFRFDGSNDWIELPGDAALDLSDGEYTQMAWVYPQNGGPVFDSVMSAADLPDAYPFLYVNGAQMTVGFGAGAARQSYTSGPILTPNDWNFVAVTFDGTTTNLYVNGALADSTNQFAGLRPSPTTRFNVGYRSDATGTEYFAGLLDNLSLYRQALTAAQIAGLWREGWQATTLNNSGAGVTTTSWQYPLPDSLRGSYQIRLRSEDVNGSRSLDYAELGIWEGLIDNTVQMVYLPVTMNNFANLPDLAVSNLTTTGGALQVTLENRGPAPVTDEFWVDVYLNPPTPPTAVNQTWDIVGTSGLAWVVTAAALPLNPGDSLTLTAGDAYYRADYSQWSGVIPAGTILYAQVDSANAGVNYGAVRETHEATGGAYNNIAGPVTAANRVFAPRGGAGAARERSPTQPRR